MPLLIHSDTMSIYPSINRRTAKDCGAVITSEDLRNDGPEPYKRVLIELPDGSEYRLNFAPNATEAEILSTYFSVFIAI
jgi:hypothetical protein